MNAAWWEALDRAGFEAVGVLVSVLWQSSIVLAGAGLVAWALRRRRPAVRHALWTAALFLAPVLPLVAWGAAHLGTPRAEIPVIPEYGRLAAPWLRPSYVPAQPSAAAIPSPLRGEGEGEGHRLTPSAPSAPAEVAVPLEAGPTGCEHPVPHAPPSSVAPPPSGAATPSPPRGDWPRRIGAARGEGRGPIPSPSSLPGRERGLGTGAAHLEPTGPSEPTTPLQPAPETPRVRLRDYPWAIGLVAYAAGALVFLALVCLGRVRLGLWIRRGRPATDPRVRAIFAAAAEALGLESRSANRSPSPLVGEGRGEGDAARLPPARRWAVVESARVHAPMTLRAVRPVVLLPAGLAAQLSDADLRAVAIHELAHVRRRDALVLTLSSLVRAVLFFHPLAWLACRQISRLAEAACDDLVLEATGEPLAYAKMLADLAEGLPRRALATEVAAGIVLSKGAFLRRIETILSDRRERIRKLSRRALTATLAATLVSVLVAVALPLGQRTTAQSRDSRSGTVAEEAVETDEAAAPHGYIELHVATRDRAYLPGEPMNNGSFTTCYAFYWKVPEKDEAGGAAIHTKHRDLIVKWSGVRTLPPPEKGVQLKDFYWDVNAPVVDPFGNLRPLGRHREALRTFTPDFKPALTPIELDGTNVPDAQVLVVRTRWVEPPSLPAPSIVVYNHRHGPNDGCTAPMWLSGWVRSGYPGAVSELTWRYLARAPQGDQYEVTRTFPVWTDKTSTSTRVVTYAGAPLTVFEDESQRIVIQSSSAKAATLPPATDEQRSAAKEMVGRFSIDVHGRPSLEEIHAHAAGLAAVLRDREHYDDYSRYKAFILLSRAKPEAFREGVLEALRESNHLIRGAAVHQLDEIMAGDELMEQYVALLSDPYSIVRYNAAECLGRRPSKQHIGNLLALLADQSIEVCGQALVALCRWEMPEVRAALQERAKSADWRVAGTAAYALASHWGERVDLAPIERLLDEELERLTGPPYGGLGHVKGIIKVLGERAEPSSLPALEKATRHAHSAIRDAGGAAIASVLHAHPEIRPAEKGTTHQAKTGEGPPWGDPAGVAAKSTQPALPAPATRPAAAEPPWGEAVEGVEVRLRAEKREWNVGEVVTFLVDVRNRTEKPLDISISQADCLLEYDGQRYRWIFPGPRNGPRQRAVPTGEERERVLGIGLFAGWAIDKDRPLVVTPGRHIVRVGWPLGEERLAWSNPAEIGIAAAPVTRLGLGRDPEKVVADLSHADAAVRARAVEELAKLIPADAPERGKTIQQLRQRYVEAKAVDIEVHVFPIRNMDPLDVAGALKKFFRARSEGPAALPVFMARKAPDAIIAVAAPKDMASIAELASELDRAKPRIPLESRAFPLRHAEAWRLAAEVDRALRARVRPDEAEAVHVSPDRRTNWLVVLMPAGTDWGQVRSVVAALDVPKGAVTRPATRPAAYVLYPLRPDIDRVLAECDTVILGTVKSVSQRRDYQDPWMAILGWAVAVQVEEVLQGQVPGKEVAIYIHSPVQSFGLHDNLEDLAGRRCAFALKQEGTRIARVEDVFIRQQQFEAQDIGRLRERIRAPFTATRLVTTRPGVGPDPEKVVADLGHADAAVRAQALEELAKLIPADAPERDKTIQQLRERYVEAKPMDIEVHVFPMKNMDPVDVAGTLKMLFRAPHRRQAGLPLFVGSKAPDLVVTIAAAKDMPLIAELASELDRAKPRIPLDSGAFPLRHAEAWRIAPEVDRALRARVKPGETEDVHVTPDRRTNTLVVLMPRGTDWEQVRSVIAALDVPKGPATRPATRPATGGREITLTAGVCFSNVPLLGVTLNGEVVGPDSLLKALQAARKEHEVLILRAPPEAFSWAYMASVWEAVLKARFDKVSLIDHVDRGTSGSTTQPAGAFRPEAGLVLHLPFDGHAKDLSGQGNHGEVHGATLTTDRFGRPGRAYRFDGADDYVRVPPAPSLDFAGAFSVSAWVKTEGRGLHQSIVRQGDFFRGFYRFALRIYIYDFVTFNTWDPTPPTWYQVGPPETTQVGRWYHLVGVFAEKELLRCYVDGKPALPAAYFRSSEPLKTEPPPRMNPAKGEPVYIGAEDYNGLGAFFKGTIDEVRIYNRALAEREVAELYAMESKGMAPAAPGEQVPWETAPVREVPTLHDEGDPVARFLRNLKDPNPAVREEAVKNLALLLPEGPGRADVERRLTEKYVRGSGGDVEVRVLLLMRADVEAMARLLTDVLHPAKGVSPADGASPAGAQTPMYIPRPRTNALLVIGTKRQVDLLAKLARRVDEQNWLSLPGDMRLFRMKHARAVQIEGPVEREVLSRGRLPRRDDIFVFADELSNSLLVVVPRAADGSWLDDLVAQFDVAADKPVEEVLRNLGPTDARIVVDVDARGDLRVGGVDLTLEQVTALLRRQGERLRDADPKAELTVVLRADPAVPYGHVVKVVEACQALGIRQIAFQTPTTGPARPGER